MPRGILNLGATCYLNSSLQILIRLLSPSPAAAAKTALWWYKLREQLTQSGVGGGRAPPPPLNIAGLVAHLNAEFAPKGFNMYEQNDVSEFILLFLEYIHQKENAPIRMRIRGQVKTPRDRIIYEGLQLLCQTYIKDHSPIYERFYGVQFVGNTPRPEMYNVLHLPVTPKTVSLADCLNAYVVGDGTPCTHTLFWKLPPVLIFYLKRTTAVGKKLQHHITFPLELSMGEWTFDGGSSAGPKYGLVGVCYHHGHFANSGHYTAAVEESGKWYYCNDVAITPIAAPEQALITPNACCLFYSLLQN